MNATTGIQTRARLGSLLVFLAVATAQPSAGREAGHQLPKSAASETLTESADRSTAAALLTAPVVPPPPAERTLSREEGPPAGLSEKSYPAHRSSQAELRTAGARHRKSSGMIPQGPPRFLKHCVLRC